jgi:Tfp pilus assembly protein PilF
VKLSRLLFPALLGLAINCAHARGPAIDTSFGSSFAADDRDETALARANALLRADPRNVAAYLVRGNIYGDRQLCLLAREDYETALRLDPGNLLARANLAEMEFRQKQYDAARTDFAALESVQQIRDLAGYKVFLCDLFAAHNEMAHQELQAFDAVGENASYYFGNAAWDLVHHDLTQARGFLTSAQNIYEPHKVELYAASLLQLGYLPLPEVH